MTDMTIARFLRALFLSLMILEQVRGAELETEKNNLARISNGTESNTSGNINHAIDLAAGYLKRACAPEGKFVYRVNKDTGQESSSYNIVRHAGVMYALGLLHRSYSEPEIANELARAAGYLQHYIGPDGHPGHLVIWSRPFPQQINIAELGATSLGLVALMEERHANPNSVSIEELEALGHFALSLQKGDGSFYSIYRSDIGVVSRWNSLYYPGETALAFVRLYELDRSREWLVAAGKALGYLARNRAGLSTVPADHWALIATAEILPYCEQNDCSISREELIRHAIQICTSILREQIESERGGYLNGAFDLTGRTAPAATRIEGLLAALEFLPQENSELRAKIEVAATRGVTFLLRVQIQSGEYAGGLQGAVATAGRDSTDIRIDYVQHALSAWLRYQESAGK